MRVKEFATESLIRRKLGDLILRVSEHVQDRAQERGIPWHYVIRMLDMVVSPDMNDKLETVLDQGKFRLRDNQTWIDLGCMYFSDRNNNKVLSINTVMREEPGAGRLNMPVIELN